ncbi:MAG: hypothetical protein KTR35_00715 [Gammaproteobacteria bacterium]|nr:hypothetical protein [Gammaproteobacteria bacterium]
MKSRDRKRWLVIGVSVCTLIAVRTNSLAARMLIVALSLGHSGGLVNAGEQQSGVNFPTSCSDDAQTIFEEGLNLLHHMMYNQADRTFNEGINNWPECAMLHWGVAMSKFQPVRPGVPSEDAISAGRKAVSSMNSIDNVSALERSFANTVSAFYKTENVGYRDRIAAWASAQETAYNQFKDDVDTTAFYALSLLATAPRGDSTFGQQRKAGRILETLNKTTTFHPGVYH